MRARTSPPMGASGAALIQGCSSACAGVRRACDAAEAAGKGADQVRNSNRLCLGRRTGETSWRGCGVVSACSAGPPFPALASYERTALSSVSSLRTRSFASAEMDGQGALWVSTLPACGHTAESEQIRAHIAESSSKGGAAAAGLVRRSGYAP